MEEFNNFKKKFEFKNECDDGNDKDECVEEEEDVMMTWEDNIEVAVESTVGKDNAEKETSVSDKYNQTAFGLSVAETEAHLVLSELKEGKIFLDTPKTAQNQVVFILKLDSFLIFVFLFVIINI